MKYFKGIFIALFLSITAFESMAQNSQSGYFSHTITQGQSLYSIASMYKVNIAEIIKLNPGSEKQIRTGDTLRIPQQTNNSAQESTRYHTIASGETLYRLTQVYKVSVASICEANPGLSAENFKQGQVIVIPPAEETITSAETNNEPVVPQSNNTGIIKSPCREMHKVTRKETIFSISREYGISEKELIDANPELKNNKLKKGEFLCIPHPRKATGFTNTNKPEKTPSNEELFNKNKKNVYNLNAINAALILPFQLNENKQNERSLMIEYYEGFLLAIDSLKKQNVSINLHVYDSGDRNKSINGILAKEELKKMHIIFGPGHNEHIKPLADFAKENDIKLVIPFTSKDNEVFSNAHVYQINTPQSYLYSQVYELFIKKFSSYNIVIIETTDDKDKADFISGFKQELDNKQIKFKSISMPNTPEDVIKALDVNRKNIIIPGSGSNVTLIKLLPIIQLLARDETQLFDLHLFGYPEWQKYTKDHLEAFYELDTYFYSSFYTNNLLDASVKFNHKYRYWYNKEMINTYPKYGMLGFDTGYFFLKGLSRYGTNFEENINNMNITPVQTGFRFERVNNWGGFINEKVFFIHMTKNHELIKLDFE